jgi:hypothetical protein
MQGCTTYWAGGLAPFTGVNTITGAGLVNLSNSAGSGRGYDEFILPFPVSTLASAQCTYSANSLLVNIQNPIWIAGVTQDANNLVSTFTVAGDLDVDVIVQWLAMV